MKLNEIKNNKTEKILGFLGALFTTKVDPKDVHYIDVKRGINGYILTDRNDRLGNMYVELHDSEQPEHFGYDISTNDVMDFLQYDGPREGEEYYGPDEITFDRKRNLNASVLPTPKPRIPVPKPVIPRGRNLEEESLLAEIVIIHNGPAHEKTEMVNAIRQLAGYKDYDDYLNATINDEGNIELENAGEEELDAIDDIISGYNAVFKDEFEADAEQEAELHDEYNTPVLYGNDFDDIILDQEFKEWYRMRFGSVGEDHDLPPTDEHDYDLSTTYPTSMTRKDGKPMNDQDIENVVSVAKAWNSSPFIQNLKLEVSRVEGASGEFFVAFM
jgi:hypothetical protein